MRLLFALAALPLSHSLSALPYLCHFRIVWHCFMQLWFGKSTAQGARPGRLHVLCAISLGSLLPGTARSVGHFGCQNTNLVTCCYGITRKRKKIHTHLHWNANKCSHIARAKVLLWYLISMLAYGLSGCLAARLLAATPTAALQHYFASSRLPQPQCKSLEWKKDEITASFLPAVASCFFSLFPARSLLFGFSGPPYAMPLNPCYPPTLCPIPSPHTQRRLVALRY